MSFTKLKILFFLIHSLGSFVEFVKIAPMLIKPDDSRDYVFEVIAPSIPGTYWLEDCYRDFVYSVNI